MHIVRREYHEKPNSSFSSFIRNTSCSRGWLRLVVQTVFGLITVVSFILIVHMAYRGPSNRPNPENHCEANGCRIVCEGAPYYDNYEEDIINTAMEAESNCKRMFLILNNPMFANSSLPLNWLFRMRSNIRTLSIIGGNLKYIPPHAFMSPFGTNVDCLILEDITLTTWLPETFIGLPNLQELFIKNSKLINIHSSALKIIDDTLKTLDIKATNIWNPINVTGSANPIKLTTVDFSRNVFLDTLNEKSFYKLQNCKILYLNSCKITALAAGTLDQLKSLEILFLNNNYIHQVPVGLFTTLLALKHKPRINIQDNPWTCDCSVDDLRQLQSQDLLIVEPTCYYPKELKGLTFLQFENYCLSNESETELIFADVDGKESYELKNSNHTIDIKYEYTCDNADKNKFTIKNSPHYKYHCTDNRIHNYELLTMISSDVNDLFRETNKWLKPIFYSKTGPHSVIEIASHGPSNYGLLWFRSKCPEEIYCVNSLPKILRVYDGNENTVYTFCRLRNGTVLIDECVVIDFSKAVLDILRPYAFLLYALTAFICLSCGALCVYGLIRKHPGLLKGSKRVLFVKHKNVDALVLPPKVPFRNNVLNETGFTNRNIFIVSPCINSAPWKFRRMDSTRSTNSNPSYISAIQPSDDQLAQWRLRHHLGNNDTTVCSHDSSAFSWIYEADSLPYLQLDSKDPIYDYVN